VTNSLSNQYDQYFSLKESCRCCPLNRSWTLAAASFDVINYRPAGAPPNTTLNADTPRGVLAGSVATYGANDWESKLGDHTSFPLGLYSWGSEGNAFENAPSVASGIVPIYMSGGVFEVFVFETNSSDTPYASILASYALGAPLFCSPFGLLTPQRPTTLVGRAGGIDNVIAYVGKAPTVSDLRLGIKMVV
jgi:hypothetical protein